MLDDYEPTGIDMRTGEPVTRQFRNHAEWVNKASSWMQTGDVCFDANKRMLVRGADFADAAYPVSILRRKADR